MIVSSALPALPAPPSGSVPESSLASSFSISPEERSTETGKRVAVVGAGPAGLFAAERLARLGHKVDLYDHMARPARKLLMAGRSGLNLTHDEPLPRFLERYGTSQERIAPAIRAFPPEALRQWAEELGLPCFTGSSQRVFLECFKASPLLRAWIARLAALGVVFHPRHRLEALDANDLLFDTPDGPRHVTADATILSMGGASWSRLGSDGLWASFFPKDCAPFAPANCGFRPDWPQDFLERHEGETLRGVSLSFDGTTRRGDLIVTKRGLEGAPLYALSASLRDALAKQAGPVSLPVTVALDLRPLLSVETIRDRLAAQRPRESRANKLRKALNLGRLERELLHDLAPTAQSPAELAEAIGNLPLTLTAPDSLDRAISTAGGLKWEALDDSYMLRASPGVFACGEMLDWEAPTGGYLLQGCFSTAHACAEGAHRWLSAPTEATRTA